jgi:hypothetical protein
MVSAFRPEVGPGDEMCGFPGTAIMRVFVLRSWPAWPENAFAMNVKNADDGMFLHNPLLGKYENVPVSEFSSVFSSIGILYQTQMRIELIF